jgi:hypothetical protein
MLLRTTRTNKGGSRGTGGHRDFGRGADLVQLGRRALVGQAGQAESGFRSDYLIALRRHSRDDDPSVYIKAMRFLHDYTAQIDWTTHDAAQADLRTTNAFAESDDAARLRLLRPALPT